MRIEFNSKFAYIYDDIYVDIHLKDLLFMKYEPSLVEASYYNVVFFSKHQQGHTISILTSQNTDYLI